MKTHTPIPPRVFVRLYRVALRLEQRWANVEYGPLFLPSRIEDAWNLLTRKGIDTTWSEDRCAAHAEGLLHYVWKANASRDSIRQREMREAGKRLPAVSLSLPGMESHPALAVDFESSLSKDPWESPLHHHLAASLAGFGHRRLHVWAYFWREIEKEPWSDVAHFLAVHLGEIVSLAALRRWPARCFPAIEADMRRLLTEESGAPGASPAAADSAAPAPGEPDDYQERKPVRAPATRRRAGTARSVQAGAPRPPRAPKPAPDRHNSNGQPEFSATERRSEASPRSSARAPGASASRKNCTGKPNKVTRGH